MIERESIPFAPNLIESMRSLGYSFETAIADLVDNSISANANNIEILLSPNFNPYLIIFDNGCSMTKNELEEALRYGARNPLEKRENTDLGRFGLGMKSASLSQCRKLIVVSKKNSNLSCFSWDLDYIIDKKGWVLLEYASEEINKLPNISMFDLVESGTYVLLQNFDRVSSSTANLNITLNSFMNTTIDHLALVFHRFLKENVSIYVNKNKIIPRDPFLIGNKATQPLKEQTINIEGTNIKVKPYILPHINKLSSEDLIKVGGKEDLKLNQGFYVYRNKRLIIWGTWFRLTRKEELSKLARVMVDIPSDLDYMWSIDIKKSSASLPDIIKRNLYSCIEESVFKSKTVHEYRGRKIKSREDINYVWERIALRDSCYEYKINRELPQLKLLFDSLDYNQGKTLEKVLSNIEESFPVSSLYLDVSKGQVNTDENIETDEKIENYFLEIKEQLDYCEKVGMDKLDMLNILLSSEPYCNHKALIEKFEMLKGETNE